MTTRRNAGAPAKTKTVLVDADGLQGVSCQLDAAYQELTVVVRAMQQTSRELCPNCDSLMPFTGLEIVVKGAMEKLLAAIAQLPEIQLDPDDLEAM